MRDEPLRIHGITRKAASHLIEDSASCHTLEGQTHDLERLRAARASPPAQHELQRHRLRKLRGAAESAIARVERAIETLHGTREELAIRIWTRLRAEVRRRVELPQG